jgi:hypothetical protein
MFTLPSEFVIVLAIDNKNVRGIEKEDHVENVKHQGKEKCVKRARGKKMYNIKRRKKGDIEKCSLILHKHAEPHTVFVEGG